MTAPAAERTTERETSSPDPHIHWSCVQHTSPPLISLCGELMNRRVPSHRFGRREVTCPVCRERAPGHLAACDWCRSSHQRWGGL